MSDLKTHFQGTLGTFQLDVNVTLPGTGVTAIFGPSGCGKTTFLRCVAGLERMENGQLEIGEEVWQDDKTFLAPHKREVGYVFQEASLFPHLSVRENLAFGLNRAKSGAKLPSLKSVEALLKIEQLIDRTPEKLSGGERQRVAIGRALMSGPKILLMDEPLAALDQTNKDEILPLMERIAGFLQIPVLYVSHDIREVERLASHIVFLERGQILAEGSLQELCIDPKAPFAKMNRPFAILEATVANHLENDGLTSLSVGSERLTVQKTKDKIGEGCKLRLYANDIVIAHEKPATPTSFPNALAARIVDVTPADDHLLNVYLELGEADGGPRVISRVTRKAWHDLQLAAGEQVCLLIKEAQLMENG